jgi:hypothetical protein
VKLLATYTDKLKLLLLAETDRVHITTWNNILKDADEEKFTVAVQKKVKLEGSKRPKLVEEDETFTYEQIKYTKYLISFK